MNNFEDRTRIKARVFNYYRKIKLPNSWLTETGKDLRDLPITDEDTEECSCLLKKLIRLIRFQEIVKKKPGELVWTVERKERLRNRMKVWEERKRSRKTQLKHN